MLEGELVLVHKRLIYESEEELQILEKMASDLMSINSEYLISLHHTERTKDSRYNLYYEYVPLTLGRWIIDIGDEMIEKLQLEMMNLATSLAHQGIRFHFNPHCIGLSRDITIKYFLSDFSYDPENKMEGFKETSLQILNFFNDFKYNSS